MFYINPGELRTRVRIQKPVKTGTGSFAAISWVDVGNISVSDPPRYILSKWEALKGMEKWVADSVQTIGGATVTIRYNSQTTEQSRILKDDICYMIVDISDPNQKRQWMQITVKAAVNG